MRRGRWSAAVASLCVVLLGLNACSNTAPSELDALTQTQPDSTRQRAMRRLSLASAYFEQGQTEVAQQEVRAALDIDPNYADAYSLLGLIHQRQQAPRLAQQSFEKALNLASQPPVRATELAAIQHNYGWFLCQQNRFAEAQVQFDRALSEPTYRQADKTAKAIDFCLDRAAGSKAAHQRNN